MQEEMRAALPKNIRQIGQIQEDYRIYVEDYVATYLNQVAGGVRDKARVLLLLGELYQEEDRMIYFVRGAVASEDEYEIGKDEVFSQESWRYFNERRQDHFPQMQVVGWAVVKGELGIISEEYISERILQDSEWKGLLFLEIDRYNCIDRFYVCGAPLRRACTGYYIFYDKNDEMQNYLITWNEQKGKEPYRAETETPVRHFREVMRDKKKEETGIKGSTVVAVCVGIALAVFTISSLNRYDKLQGLDGFIGDIATFVEDKLSGIGQNIEVIDRDKSDATESEKESNADIVDSGQNGDDVGGSEPEGTIDKNLNQDEIIDADLKRDDTVDADLEQDDIDDADSKQNETVKADSKQEGTDLADSEQTASENGNQNEFVTDVVDSDLIQSEPVSSGEVIKPSESYTVYIVKPGDTLFGISRQYYGDVHMVEKICELNQIENGDSIFFGQKILLP